MTTQLRIQPVPGTYAVAQLPADAPVPDWVNGPGFQAITRSADELTLVCLQARVPADVTAQRDWICYRTIGPFAFDAAGIVTALITPLSDAGIGVFVVCTFDGEHVLVPASAADDACRAFSAAGHIMVAADAR